MQIQLNFAKYVIEEYKVRALLFLLTIVCAAILELLLVSFFYVLTSVLLGSAQTDHSVLGFRIQLTVFDFWFVAITVFSTFARIAIIIFQANNMAIVSNGLVKIIYSKVISMPLVKFREKPEAEVLSSLTMKIQHCTDNILVQLSQIISAVTISTGIIIALVIIDPVTTGIVFLILIAAYLMIMKFSKAKLKIASKQLSIAHDRKNDQILNTYRNAEAIMAYGEYSDNINAMTKIDFNLRVSQKLISIYGSAPRYLIEGAIIVCAAIPLLYFSSEKNLSIDNFAFIGAFIVGSVRLLPLINQVYAGLNSVRGSEHVARDIVALIETKEKRGLSGLSTHNNSKLLIKSKNLSIKLNKTIIKYPDISLKAGESLVITGQSGVGKSKLLHTLLGLIQIDSGSLYNGCFDKKTQKNIGMGYASQQPIIVSNLISEIVAAGEKFDQIKVNEILNIMSLSKELSNRKFIGDKGALLSGGQQQRLALCNALYRASRLLILDEPTSALSAVMSQSIMKKIITYCRTKNISVICVTHDLSIVRMFDKQLEIR